MSMLPIALMDYGSGFIRFLIVELEDGIINVLGVGESKADGIMKGKVTDMPAAVASIKQAAHKAITMANTEIYSLWVTLSGEIVQTIPAQYKIAVTRGTTSPPTVTEEDTIKVQANAQEEINIPSKVILETIVQEYGLDSKPSIRNPIGLTGNHLSVKASIVTIDHHEVVNINEAIRQAGYNVNSYHLGLSASAYAVLTRDDKSLGVVVVDIGWDKTDIGIFVDGALRFTQTVPLGGHKITQDLAKILKIGLNEATILKHEYGSVNVPDSNEVIQCRVSNRLFNVKPFDLNGVIFSRQKEIFDLVGNVIESSGLWKEVNAGIVLTGGGAELKGIADMAEACFCKPARLGMPSRLTGVSDKLYSPAWANVIGLIKLLMDRERDKLMATIVPKPKKSKLGRLWDTILGKADPLKDTQLYLFS